MARKAWESAVGDPTVNPDDADSLLAQAKSDRETKRLRRADEIEAAEHETRKAELDKKKAAAEAAVEKTGEKKEEPSSFKFTGNVNYPELMQKQIDERDRLREQAENAAANQQQVSNELREKLHTQEMLVMKTGFEAQMQMLGKMIESNVSKGGIVEQLNAAREMAKEIGFVQGQPGGGTEVIQVELKKLDFEHTLALRKMNKEDKAEERRWQLELRRLDDQRDVKREELAQSRERNDMFARAPETFGTAIAKGMLTSKSESEVTDPPSRGVKSQVITVDKGESGQFKCVQCETMVAIGPTARRAVCASCGMEYDIRRRKEGSQEVSEEE